MTEARLEFLFSALLTLVFGILGFLGRDWKQIREKLAMVGSRVRIILAIGSLVGSLLLTSMGWHRLNVLQRSMAEYPTSSEWEEYRKHLTKITGQTFSNEVVELDGKEFEDCRFISVTFMFRGQRPFRLRHNLIDGGGHPIKCRLAQGPWATGAEMIRGIMDGVCDELKISPCPTDSLDFGIIKPSPSQ